MEALQHSAVLIQAHASSEISETKHIPFPLSTDDQGKREKYFINVWFYRELTVVFDLLQGTEGVCELFIEVITTMKSSHTPSVPYTKLN